MSDDRSDGAFRVMLKLNIIPGKEKEFEKTWYGVGDVISRQPANLGQWLLKSDDEPGVYYIMSDWTDEPSFRTFERSEEHLGHRTKLHPFRDGGSMAVMHVVRHMPAAASAS